MKSTCHRVYILIGALIFSIMAATGPIKVSQNGRYFLDASGNPFYFLGDTQWELFRLFTLDEARLILADRKAKGFNVISIMLVGITNGTAANVAGQAPFPTGNVAAPNEKYFAHVDSVVKAADSIDIQLLIGIYHMRFGYLNTTNAGPWAKWITSRYHNFKNVIWTWYPVQADGSKPLCQAIAAGVAQGDSGAHLVTMHPDPWPQTSSFMHSETWLAFNCIQVWSATDQIFPMVTADYNKTPAKPVTMLEAGYEGGSEYGFLITPLLARRQAYTTCLAGGFHGYGHRKLVGTSMAAGWQTYLNAPGAIQLGFMKKTLMSLKNWWTLVPDQTVLSSGASSTNLGARSSEGTWLVAYIYGSAAISVNMAKITASDSATAVWINPDDSTRQVMGTFPASGTHAFSRPSGWSDGLLVITEKGAATEIKNGLTNPRQNELGQVSPFIRNRFFLSNKKSAVDLRGKRIAGVEKGWIR